ncbi:MAG: phenazine biosynthesis protein, partial [Rhodobacteraceae bacterium]|nr:phenazine biosynthesis protein [Paracoccaceae bacterium]
MTRYLVLDVFTDQPFGGNQLAVIPDARALPQARLQQIAREFNFSETTFVYPPRDPAHTARVRIFTPTMEIPFAGHPTIGTAVALAQMGHGPEMMLELGIGPLRAHATEGAARFTTSAPLQILAQPEPALVARALGLPGAALRPETHAPALASLGLPFVLTELTDREALSRIVTDSAAFREGAARYPGALDFAIMAYVREGQTVHARMFAPLDNIPEDPATGSAAA